MIKKDKFFVTMISIFSLFLLWGCVPDVSEYNYIIEHWKGEWTGWYEISNANGQYAELDGAKDVCSAFISMDHMTRLWMEFYDSKGKKVCDFLGAYKHKESNKYGQAWFYEIIDNRDKKISVDISLDGESHGDDNLGIFKGRIGTKTDGMDIYMYMRRNSENTEVK